MFTKFLGFCWWWWFSWISLKNFPKLKSKQKKFKSSPTSWTQTELLSKEKVLFPVMKMSEILNAWEQRLSNGFKVFGSIVSISYVMSAGLSLRLIGCSRTSLQTAFCSRNLIVLMQLFKSIWWTMPQTTSISPVIMKETNMTTQKYIWAHDSLLPRFLVDTNWEP